MQQVDFNSEEAQHILQTPDERPLIGLSAMKYQRSLSDYLRSMVNRTYRLDSRTTSKFEKNEEGIVITSSLPELGSVQFSKSELQTLESHAVLCHNDLDLHSVLVRPKNREFGPTGYEIVGIVNWTWAGIVPFAVEFGFSDGWFGQKKSNYDWYSLYKEKAARLMPKGEVHEKLIEATRLIIESWSRSTTRRADNEFRRRWLKREGMEMSDDVLVGWKRVEPTPTPTKLDPKMEPQNTARQLQVVLGNQRVAREPHTVVGGDDEQLLLEVMKDLSINDTAGAVDE
jgi:hypothetical protein